MDALETPTKGKLATILEELEELAHREGVPAYRELMRGLNIRIEELETGWQVAIAREWPSVPSEIEESTVVRHLAPLYHGQWHRTNKQAGRGGRIYNVSKMDYHR